MTYFLSQNQWTMVPAYLAIVCLFLNAVIGQSEPADVEKGAVHWTNFDQGMKLASKKGRPVFLLFQEIPG